MARTSVDMENHTCDDRSCGREKPARAGDRHAPAGWLIGTVAQADAEGNVPVGVEWVPWEACRETHVRAAAAGALQRHYDATGAVLDEPAPAPKDEPVTRDVTELAGRA